LIVAGPGTGKTHTFRKVVEALPERSEIIIFTLINNLVDDLRELEQIPSRNVRVFTFHGFCKSLLYSEVGGAGDFSYTGALPSLVAQDAELLNLDFSVLPVQAISELLEEEESFLFYMSRADYYKAVGYVDSVYRVFAHFRENPENIPRYALVIADEYQDFNRLEAAFIDLLSTVSPLLVAGDDDQSLYKFRYASHEFIRRIFASPDFENFNLPLCSRCPPVLIQATNALIETVRADGHLQDRIPKDFECYWPDKFVEHGKHPHLIQAHCSAKSTVNLFIENEIKRIYAKERVEIDASNDIPFLVIGPNSSHQLKTLYTFLKPRLGADFDLDISGKTGITIEEGWELLRKDPRSNLGWRIVLFSSGLEQAKFEEVIRESYKKKIDLVDLLPDDFKTFHLQQPEEMEEVEPTVDESSHGPKVKFVTFLGAKGLSARHVFVIGMNNGEFPAAPKVPTDPEICQLIVAITRAKHSCTLISNTWYSVEIGRSINSPSKFLTMIPSDLKKLVRLTVKAGVLVRS
jgi:superfamily I DNA/RNA helicase